MPDIIDYIWYMGASIWLRIFPNDYVILKFYLTDYETTISGFYKSRPGSAFNAKSLLTPLRYA